MDLLHLTTKEKRRSLIGSRPSSVGKNTPKSSPKNSPRVEAVVPATLSIEYESPPLVFYGTPTRSTGALLSGQLELRVGEIKTKLQALEMVLLQQITTQKPFAKDCPHCRTTSAEIKKWIFLSEPASFGNGVHSFPFSDLLPGDLPTTSHGALGSINYVLCARAQTSLGEKIEFTRTLDVQRALQPLPDRTCCRTFPPTKLGVNVTLPHTIHPIGLFSVQLHITRVAEERDGVLMILMVEKINWRIEQHMTIVSPACAEHERRLTTGSLNKSVFHQRDETIGHGTIKRRDLKTDYGAANGGHVDVDFEACIDPASKHPACDVKSLPHGLCITHTFVIEILIAEFAASLTNLRLKSPTGRARVLRIMHPQILTARSGMGIAWDEEQPPMYADVPRSPPGYAALRDEWRQEEEPVAYDRLEQA